MLAAPPAAAETLALAQPSSGGSAPSAVTAALTAPVHTLAAPSYYFLDERAVPGPTPASTPLELPAQDRELDAVYAALREASASLGLAPPAGAATAASGYYFLDEYAAAPRGGVPSHAASYDVLTVRRDFPLLAERVNGKPLVWLDNAATTQKPQVVIDRLTQFYTHENSNIHRAAHTLAARATDAYEDARQVVAHYLGGADAEEVVFVRGATEGINLLAQTLGRQCVGAGDEVLITWLEHHANIVPWQQLCETVGAHLRVVPVDESGQVRLDAYAKLLSPRTKIVSLTQVSNAIGTVVPVAEMIALAHHHGARVVVDGAQSVSHMRVDVRALDADFFVFSGHKVFGPTGIGAVWGRREMLEALPPWQGGGNMIEDVSFERTVYQHAPARFEAGTGNIADAAGLAAALRYVQAIGLERIEQHEHALIEHATARLAQIPGLRLIGTVPQKAGALSLVIDGCAPEEVGRALNEEGIAVRAGHHCAQPILRRFGLEATVRPSFALYNTHEEVDQLADALARIAASRRP